MHNPDVPALHLLGQPSSATYWLTATSRVPDVPSQPRSGPIPQGPGIRGDFPSPWFIKPQANFPTICPEWDLQQAYRRSTTGWRRRRPSPAQILRIWSPDPESFTQFLAQLGALIYLTRSRFRASGTPQNPQKTLVLPWLPAKHLSFSFSRPASQPAGQPAARPPVRPPARPPDSGPGPPECPKKQPKIVRRQK